MRPLYWLTGGIVATVVGALLWMWSPPVAIVAAMAVAIGAGLAIEPLIARNHHTGDQQ